MAGVPRCLSALVACSLALLALPAVPGAAPPTAAEEPLPHYFPILMDQDDDRGTGAVLGATSDGSLLVGWTGPGDPPVYMTTMRTRVLSDSTEGISWGPVLNMSLTGPGSFQSRFSNREPQSVRFLDETWLIWQSRDQNGKPVPAPPARWAQDIVERHGDGRNWTSDAVIISEITPEVFGELEREEWPATAVFQGRLYVAYFNVFRNAHWIEVISTANGVNWTAPVQVSPGRDGKVITAQPALAVYRDRLYLTYHRENVTSAPGDTADVMLASTDGTSWTVPVAMARHPTAGGESFPVLAAFRPAGSGVDQLVLAFRVRASEDPENRDSDILLRTFDGSTWSGELLVSSPFDAGEEEYPALVAYKGLLYIGWDTNSDAVADGPDFDVVMRTWDGTAFGPITLLSRRGDSFGGTTPDDPFYRLGWDQRVQFQVLGDNLWAAWASRDDLFAPDIRNQSWNATGDIFGTVVVRLVAGELARDRPPVDPPNGHVTPVAPFWQDPGSLTMLIVMLALAVAAMKLLLAPVHLGGRPALVATRSRPPKKGEALGKPRTAAPARGTEDRPNVVRLDTPAPAGGTDEFITREAGTADRSGEAEER